MAIVTDKRKSVPTTSNEHFRPDWQAEMRHAIRNLRELCEHLELPSRLVDTNHPATKSFSLFVPQPFLSRMEKANVNDPLLRQVLPVMEETESVAGFSRDPVNDQAFSNAPGLIKKYSGRALLVSATVCAVHCRYCFRREFPYGETPHSNQQWQPALDSIAADSSIKEVILSGGDPLTLVDDRLEELLKQIEAIKHVRFLRIHSRLPVMIPARITDRLIDILQKSRLNIVFVLHANHANEFDQHVDRAIGKLVEHSILVFNQSVLLKGVNDSVQALVDLSERLIESRVTPYYLHQLDRVHGSAHFEVSIQRGRQLIEEIRKRLPGYAVPRYVVDDGNLDSKTFLA